MAFNIIPVPYFFKKSFKKKRKFLIFFKSGLAKQKIHVILDNVIYGDHKKVRIMNLISNNSFYYFFICFAFYFRKRGGSVAAVLKQF